MIYKSYAPSCSIPGCINKVAYHKKYQKGDGSSGYNWKSCCEYHRSDNMGKAERDRFITSRGGCENKDGRLGWTCGDPTTDSLTIDHSDGNKHNNSEENIVVLCANCHNKKTKLFGDHLNRYRNLNPRFYDYFEEV